MPAEPTLKEGKRYQGHGTFRNVNGIVVETKESPFGLKYAKINSVDGTEQWCRSIYFTEDKTKKKSNKKKK